MNHTYSQASIEGNYWFRKVGGILNIDALGTMQFDGNGNFSGSFVLNVSGKVTSLSYAGTYQVNPDGTGMFTWVRTFPDGKKHEMHSHIVAWKAEGTLMTEIYSSLDDPDPASGELSGRIIVRCPR